MLTRLLRNLSCVLKKRMLAPMIPLLKLLTAELLTVTSCPLTAIAYSPVPANIMMPPSTRQPSITELTAPPRWMP